MESIYQIFNFNLDTIKCSDKFVETTGSSKSCVLKYDAIGVSYFLQPNRIKTVGVIANQCNDFPLAIFDKMLIIITVLNLDRPNE